MLFGERKLDWVFKTRGIHRRYHKNELQHDFFTVVSDMGPQMWSGNTGGVDTHIRTNSRSRAKQ